MPRICDFVKVNQVNPVVQLTQVREMSRTETLPAEIAPLMDGYLVIEGANASAVHGLLSALPMGGAFLLSGVYGTGKSHLLSIIGLLAEFPDARSRFAKRNPILARLLQPLFDRRFFVAYISLDEFDPTAFALETIVAKEVATEAQRKGFAVPKETSARGEWLHGVWNGAQSRGFAGIVILIDELAMFLNAKSSEALNRDASFLQFLAQATKRVPLLLVGALQRGVEDLQRIEPYALTQVRDRFQQTWLLSFGHAEPLINAVLLSKHSEVELRQRLSELHHKAAWASHFSVDELFACYPFHPLTVRCLEQSIGAFFSRTRSIVTFVQSSVTERANAQWDELIMADALIDHFEADMNTHPQLRPFAQTVLPYFERWDKRQEARDTGKTTKLVKVLLAFQIGGDEPSAQTLADAMMCEANEVWAMLERLRTEGNFVDAVKRTGSPSDTYRLDPQITVTDALRRRLVEATQSLSDDDQRLLRFAWECRSEEWLPPPLFESRTVTTRWMRTQRKVIVTITDLRRISEAQIRQAVANLSLPHTDECLHLFIAVPVASDEQARHFAGLLQSLPDERFARAIVGWLPRELNDAERQRWRENTAVWILAQDLSLAESELGMKMLERIHEMLSARQWEMQRLMQRLYADGTILTVGAPSGAAQRVAAKAAPTGFNELVQIAAEVVLPLVFPRFAEIAPRREASAQTNHALTRLILRGLPATSLDVNAQRWLEVVAAGMGIVVVRNGKWTVTAPSAGLTDAVLQAIGDGANYRHVEAILTKSEFGLTAELCQLVIAALLRVGILTAFDRNGTPLSTETITTPLSRSIAMLAPAQVLRGDEWRSVRSLLIALLDETIPEMLTAETQQQLWIRLREQVNAWKLMAQDVSARLTQWQRELGQTERQWQSVWERLHLCSELTSLLSQPLSAADGLQQLRAWADERRLGTKGLREWRDSFETAAHFLSSSAELLSAWRYLSTLAGMQLPDELAQMRTALLTDLQSGETLLSRWQERLQAFRQFRDAYANAYFAHHERTHNSDAFKQLHEFRQSDAMRLLAVLNLLPDAPDDGREALSHLQEALGRQCSETALTLRPQLQLTPVCQRCGLALHETLTLDADAIISTVMTALQQLKAWLCADEQRGSLRRYLDAASLSDRTALERVLTLTPQSSDAEWQAVVTALPVLQKALSPHAVAEADLDELCALLEERFLTPNEATGLFQDWLSSKAPSPETRVRFVKGQKTINEEGAES